MKNYIFLCLAAIVAFAQASANVDPAQTMIYWVAYRFEAEAYQENTGSMRIATGCAGTAPKGRCNFDEFINHITRQPEGTYTTDLSNKWDLDPEAGMKELHGIGFTGRAYIPRLLPHLAPGAYLSFNDGVTAIMGYVERANQEMKSSGRNPRDHQWFQGLRQGAEEVIAIRTQEQEQGFKTDLTNWLTRNGINVTLKLESQTWTMSDDTVLKWNVVDWEDLVKKIDQLPSTSVNNKTKGALKRFRREYTQVGGTSNNSIIRKGQDHATLIETYNQLSMVVNGMC